MAAPGDWPWHAALYRDDRHVCDGTLVSSDWVLTTESCFQGQPKATWIAVFGSIRLNAAAPWTQRRRIVGMVKSPVEGSTAALVRLETSVVFSDFIRPVCLTDELDQPSVAPLNHHNPDIIVNYNQPQSAPLINKRVDRRSGPLGEDRQFFNAPLSAYQDDASAEYNAEFSDDRERNPRAEAYSAANVHQKRNANIPVVVNPNYFDAKSTVVQGPAQQPAYVTTKQQQMRQATTVTSAASPWTNCNTLGWSRQREHLQRVQVRIGDMTACENVSIATVNSICAEAAYHKSQDCTEEEFAGSPVFCTFGENGKQWALVAISSWRIACAQSGLERPRMYDKITSNAGWIRDTVNAA